MKLVKSAGFFGDDRFVDRIQEKSPKNLLASIFLKFRRQPAPPLPEIVKLHNNRNAAIVAAYATGDYSYQQLAELFGLDFTTIGAIVRSAKGRKKWNTLNLNLARYAISFLLHFFDPVPDF